MVSFPCVVVHEMYLRKMIRCRWRNKYEVEEQKRKKQGGKGSRDCSRGAWMGQESGESVNHYWLDRWSRRRTVSQYFFRGSHGRERKMGLKGRSKETK